jgi:hypothetical protein
VLPRKHAIHRWPESMLILDIFTRYRIISYRFIDRPFHLDIPDINYQEVTTSVTEGFIRQFFSLGLFLFVL